MPYNERYKGDIADSLTPTIDNVIRKFIMKTMRDILFNDKVVSFNFVFKQPEAIDFIEQVLFQETENYKEFDWYKDHKEKDIKLVQALRLGSDKNSDLPSLVINDYKVFFELLRQYYEKDIELWFQRTKRSGFPRYEMENCFEQI